MIGGPYVTKTALRPDACGFSECWNGYCNHPKPCPRHGDKVCWECKKPATGNCGFAGMFVCGVDYCSDHPHERRH